MTRTRERIIRSADIMKQLLTIAALLAMSVIGAAQSVSHVDFLAPPDSLQEFVQGTKVILVGRVVGTTQGKSPPSKPAADPRFTPPGSVPFLDHEMEVLRVIKGERIPGVVHVLQPGGTSASGGELVMFNTGKFPAFDKGDRVILFLAPKPDLPSEFLISFGPGGVFKFQPAKDLVTVPSGVAHYAEFAGLSTTGGTAFIDKLAEIVKTSGRGSHGSRID